MSLSKIQKTFVRLAKRRAKVWAVAPYKWPYLRKVKKEEPKTIKVKVINAVTGEETTARTQETSVAKLKKWLKLRNIRAEFTEMHIKKNSTWFKLTDGDFENFPVIVKIGSYKVPYVISYIRDRETHKGRTTVRVLLSITDNVDFLAVLSQKKELLEKKFWADKKRSKKFRDRLIERNKREQKND